MTKQLFICMMLIVGSFKSVSAETLSVAVGQWPPYLAEDLKHNGVIAHLISDIFIAEGYEVKYSFLPWGRVYEETAKGLHDATAVWMHKPEREQDFAFSQPVLQEQFVFFHLESFTFDWRTLSDLRALSIGGVLKYSYGEEFDNALNSGMLSMDRVVSEQQNFEKLLKKRIQIYPQEKNVGYSILRKNLPSEKVAKITHHPKPFLNNLSYVLFPKARHKSLNLMARFNKRLMEFKESGQYDAYFEALDRGDYEKIRARFLSSHC